MNPKKEVDKPKIKASIGMCKVPSETNSPHQKPRHIAQSNNSLILG